MALNRHNQSEKMQDYIRALEEERIKIQVFQRELPLCLELVTQAIESCKQQLSGTTSECNLQNEQSEGSEQTSSDVPVLEEFIPIPIPMIIKKPSSNSDSHCEQHDFKKPKIDDDISVTDKDRKNGYSNDKNVKKPDWLRSAQLWNQSSDDAPSKGIQDDSTKKVGVKRDGSGGAFHPFKKEKNADIMPPASTGSMARTGGGGTENKKEEQEGPSRKSRRCWSPQLHKRFLQALHELGGSHVATPKQIRDLMKVDGLTNDEVKSHLQKYRLHTRRPSPSSQNITTATTQAPQFVVVTGGLWMPPEYTAAMATPATSGEAGVAPNGIYAPVASLPPPLQETSASPTQRQHSNNKTSDSNVRGSHSPVTSSSTHTSTASLAY